MVRMVVGGMWSRNKIIFIGLLAVLSAGCGSFAYHRVQPGETLYSISFRYGLDYRQVAKWNGLKPPYTIYNGQQLQLTPSGGRDNGPVRTAPPVVVAPTPSSSPPLTDTSSVPIRWRWPVHGKVLRTFAKGNIARKGIDIGGKAGMAVRAAASGRVVYAGNGFLNYGKLIIIKHNDNYLSAYAYNQVLRVKEGESVAAGQQIAEMGHKTKGDAMLHFEIRYDGQPQDPLRYLPARRQ